MRPSNVNSVMQGQAAVYRVVSELLFRGLRVALPAVDDRGVDLLVLPSIRVQVKSAYLRINAVYPQGSYWFKFTQGPIVVGSATVKKRGPRQFSSECDFVVLVGIDQGRFWVVPASLLDGVHGVCVGHELLQRKIGRDQVTALRDQGLTQAEIGERLGISQVRVSQRLAEDQQETKTLTKRLRQYEGRWELLEEALAVVEAANFSKGRRVNLLPIQVGAAG